ncbi:MAG: gamma-glutamyl-gamma-aminobutyrate hydrolase family protein [Acidihalobacter sp.]
MTVLVGITTFGPRPSKRYELPRGYVQAVTRAGGIPVGLPAQRKPQPEVVKRLDALILIGGEDMDPTLMGDMPQRPFFRLSPERDRAELALARAAIDSGLPTLGICRGMQVLNVVLGGRLHLHLPEVYGEEQAHVLPEWGTIPHEVHLTGSSRLSVWLGTEYVSAACSCHHQAVSSLGQGLAGVGWAPDGVLEAFEHETHPFLVGVQWHPELNAANDPLQQRLFDVLVQQAEALRARPAVAM